ncbi:MAG TPA: hypothetical protein VMU19_04555 [Bryobacteraceae bacterium]|nr:hypothetical protein [Bryobacteraceae bacterium]
MRAFVFSVALSAVCLPVLMAQSPAGAAGANTVNPSDIIRKFAAKEAEFKQARDNYTYRQTLKMQILDASGNPTREEWDLVEDIIFNPEGQRTEKVVYAPVSTIESILVTPEDQEDLRNTQPFVLTTTDLPNYQIDYLGREKVDEIGTYTFSVKPLPKKMVVGKRYFEGEIWVDDRDLQIVKTYGKGTGLKAADQRFPKFETYREQIDGKYWFPTYTHADDTLHFKDGQDVHVAMTVKYQDYKRYVGKATIQYGDEVDPNAPPKK